MALLDIVNGDDGFLILRGSSGTIADITSVDQVSKINRGSLAGVAGLVSDDFVILTTAVPVQTSLSLKVWNGSAWVQRSARMWNGSAWVQGKMKCWDGLAWTETT